MEENGILWLWVAPCQQKKQKVEDRGEAEGLEGWQGCGER